MKCLFCNGPAGFLKGYHSECKTKVERHLAKLEDVLNRYNQSEIDFQDAKHQLVELASADSLYQNYLWNTVGGYNRSQIRTNETLIYVETTISIAESKNRKTMERTGLSYAHFPTWEYGSSKIGDMATVAFTDQAVYLLVVGKTYIYPYSKVVNIGFEHDKRGTSYFDVKTTSPHPHRFELWATDGRSISKGQNITLCLSCLCGW